jgi:hypothetical protein
MGGGDFSEASIFSGPKPDAGYCLSSGVEGNGMKNTVGHGQITLIGRRREAISSSSKG